MNRSEAGKLGYLAARAGQALYWQKKREDDISKYELNPLFCEWCNAQIPYEKYKKRAFRFCKWDCWVEYKQFHSNKREERVFCLECGLDVTDRDGPTRKFCSQSCAAKHRDKKYIEAWLAGVVPGIDKNGMQINRRVKRWLITERGEKCEKCGWCERHEITGKIPIAVDHIDGNSKNSRPENLRLLCPNCHSLTPNFGSLNWGNGREIRRKGHIKEKRISNGKTTIQCSRCGNETTNKKYCSQKCCHLASRLVNRPSIEQIEDDVSKMSMVKVGEKYGVSDNAVRLWIRAHIAMQPSSN